jgi:hypothetical protein
VPEISYDGIELLVKLAQYDECAQILQQAGFINYCEKLQPYAEWTKEAEILLQVLNRPISGRRSPAGSP